MLRPLSVLCSSLGRIAAGEEPSEGPDEALEGRLPQDTGHHGTAMRLELALGSDNDDLVHCDTWVRHSIHMSDM